MKKHKLFLTLILLLWIGNLSSSYAEIKQGLEISMYAGKNFSAKGGCVQSLDEYRETRSELEESGIT